MSAQKSVRVTLATACLLSSSVFAETVNRIVAVVNEDIITQADILGFIQALKEEETGDGKEMAVDPQMPRMVLQRLIDERLMLQEARKSGVIVETEDVLERYQAFRSRFPSDELFRQSLAQTGLSEEHLKRRIREQLMVQRLIEYKVRSTLVVSPQEVAKELEKNPQLVKSGNRMRVSHILVRVNENRTQEQARTSIEQLRAQLASGADFAVAARRYSEDQHREDGGAMGWVAAGELMPELDSAIAALTVGELSQPIQSRLGFHLVRVEETRSAASLPMTEAHQAVYQQLYQQKYQQAMLRLMGELRKKAYIQIPGAADLP